jgi:hypothetical protein
MARLRAASAAAHSTVTTAASFSNISSTIARHVQIDRDSQIARDEKLNGSAATSVTPLPAVRFRARQRFAFVSSSRNKLLPPQLELVEGC